MPAAILPDQITTGCSGRTGHCLRSLTILAVLSLGACGGSESPSTGAESGTASKPAPAAPSPEMSSRGTPAPSGPVNSLSFVATGDAEFSLESDGSDLMLTGGCLDHNVIGMSFTRGRITDRDLFQVRLRTADSVKAGQTGVFEVSELGWYNGQIKPQDLPTDANILVPDAYEGSGSLTLTLHEPGGLNGRMAGTVEGTVKQAGGDNEAVIKSSFDINLGCSVVSLDGGTR